MKLQALKIIIKEAVKEVIQEELKDILLEAIKGSKVVPPQSLVESITTIPSYTPQIINSQPPQMSLEERRNSYKNILGETATQFTSQYAQNFKPNSSMDNVNGSLPQGEVGLEQIIGLMNK